MNHDYRQDRLSQGLFVMATDLHKYSQETPGAVNSEFVEMYRDTKESQPPWVIENLNDADMPLGFAEAAAQGNVELVEFDDPRVDHEWLMHPGSDFFEVLVRQYYPLICGERSLQTIANQTSADKCCSRWCAPSAWWNWISRTSMPIFSTLFGSRSTFLRTPTFRGDLLQTKTKFRC